MRTKEVTINEKKITIKELRFGTAMNFGEAMAKELDAVFAADKPSDVYETVRNIVAEKYLPRLFPEIDEADLKMAYMSEVEDLVKAFAELNFPWLKAVGAMALKQTPYAPKSQSLSAF